MVAGNSSHCGKTTVCLGLIGCLRSRGLNIFAAKSGPDYIDRAWLAKACGKAAANLDIWMSGSNFNALLQSIYGRKDFTGKNSLLLVEGAMGLYDGREDGGNSCAELALRLGLPILLCLNIAGMGQTCAAMTKGILNYKIPALGKKAKFLGLICTFAGSTKHEKTARFALGPVLQAANIPLLGFLPKKDAPSLASRHLGLVQAEEIKKNFDIFKDWLEKHCDVDAILKRLEYFYPDLIEPVAKHVPAASNKTKEFFFPPCKPERKKKELSIAIAHDEAFSFIYADLPNLLYSLGATVIFFSPLHSRSYPICDGLFLPGGYPEVFAKKLSGKKNFISWLKNLREANSFIYAECGAYIFLGESLSACKNVWEFSGLLPLNFTLTKHLQELGYRQARLISRPEITVRGHVFHYSRILENLGFNFWKLDDASGACEGLRIDKIWASWLHLYPAGSLQFWKYWLKEIQRQKYGNQA